MAERRYRSPEGSRRKDYKRSRYRDESPRMRPGEESLSSSSSSCYIDISHIYPQNRSGIRTFFTAPSERRLRKRRSNRLLAHDNSSSSSINTDLAYGTGFIKGSRRKVRSRKGKEIDRERTREYTRERDYTREKDSTTREKQTSERTSIGRRLTTDAEILAVGAGLAKLARDQNKLDLKSARNGKRADTIAVRETFSQSENRTSRGLMPSRVSHDSQSQDEDGWESASDAESESSIDSRLAFGEEPQSSGWFGWGGRKLAPPSRKSTIVDPRLFGPENSLHGIVTEPVGFGDAPWSSSSDFGQRSSVAGRAESVASGSQAPLQRVYPVPTSDPTRFDVARSSVVSSQPEPYMSSRPAPIPLQQPQPFTPVSQSVFEPYTTSSGAGITKGSSSSSGRTKSLAEAALVGVAGAAVGAAIASERKSERKDKDDRKDKHNDFRDDVRPKRRDSERRDDKDDRRREKEKRDSSPDRHSRREKKSDKDRGKDSADDSRREKRRERRRDETDEQRDERRERRREERRSERGDDRSQRGDDRHDSRRTKSEVAGPTVNPFEYQVADDAFPTPTYGTTPVDYRIESAPTVVTVEREPDFARRRSSSIKGQSSSDVVDYRRGYSEWDEREQRYVGRDSRDRALHEAETTYQEAEHSTAPIEVAAIAAAAAAVAAEGVRESRSDKRRDERRGERRDYDDYNSHDVRESRERGYKRESKQERVRERDPIQEEADRAYREIVMARKIASQVIRSRSPSPNRSVIDKYEDKEEEVIRIVTPPGMDDQKKKGPYDAPNADFRLDNVLEDPKALRDFASPIISGSANRDGYFLTRDPDASKPRPLLNLVRPTPTPSPMPEKQTRSSDSSKAPESKAQESSVSASDVVIDSKGNVVVSPTSSSAASKGVTWGQNETKHYEVESPSEHRDEFVSSPELKSQEAPKEKAKPAKESKRSGWGAIAAGIIGAGAGAAAASSSDISKTSKKSKAQESEQPKDSGYQYRGVVVEPEDLPRSERRQSPPEAGPKPSSAQVSQTSRVPGAFDDDLDFTATVAAGLQDTGFDPNIVINDATFRRRDSPPGSNMPGNYSSPYAETVSDLSSVPRSQGDAREELPTASRVTDISQPAEEEFPITLSKKEQKKREKAARRQSSEVTPLDDTSSKNVADEDGSYFEPKLSKKEQKKRDKENKRNSISNDPELSLVDSYAEPELVEEPESYTEKPSKSKSKKSKRASSTFEDAEEDASRDRKVSVPVDAFDDLREAEDDWSTPKKSKRKSKSDGERFDSPSRSEVASELERSSSKKSKDKSKRKSDVYEPEPDPTEVSLPPSTPSENSRDGDFDESRRSRKSSKRESADRDDSRSVVSTDTSRAVEDEPRKSKKKSRSNRDDFDDTRSVASAPAGDDFEDAKRKKKEKRNSGGFFGLFGSKSEVGAREESPKGSKDDFEDVKKKSKKSKRQSLPDAASLYGDVGAQSVGDLSRFSNGHSNGSHEYEEDNNRESRRDDHAKSSRARTDSTSSQKDSFLVKAGTLGAGVGLAGAAVAIAAEHRQRSKAEKADKRSVKEQSLTRSSADDQPQPDILDPEVIQRQFRPSIDPQYGDLLPLPPSDPESPDAELLENLPNLPDSRPDTPESERLARERAIAAARRTLHEAPAKSPSQSAVPLKFILGNRSAPSSPKISRASPPTPSPSTSQEMLALHRNRSRPSSWDNTKEYKPLYLVESNRRSSTQEQEEPLPSLPPSQDTSRSSSQHNFDGERPGFLSEPVLVAQSSQPTGPLSIDTSLASMASRDLLDSGQSTPKAAVQGLGIRSEEDNTLPTLPQSRDAHTETSRDNSTPGLLGDIAAAAAIVSSIGYFASSPRHPVTKDSWLEELPSRSSIEGQPSPVDPMSKDRSSYLLQSSPMSKKDEIVDAVGSDLTSPTTARGASILSDEDVAKDTPERNSFTSFDEPESKSDADSQELPRLQDEADETEPADSFVLKKSKKDKKKDKKKGKSVSRSSTIDESSAPADSEPSASDLIASKSGSQEPIPDANEDPASTDVSQPPAQENKEPDAADEFFTSTSRKDKKKNKKKNKSVSSWDFPEPEEAPNTPEVTEPLANEGVVQETPLVADSSTPESSKKKKRDKKKTKSVTFEDDELVKYLEPSPTTVEDGFPIRDESSADVSSTGLPGQDLSTDLEASERDLGEVALPALQVQADSVGTALAPEAVSREISGDVPVKYRNDDAEPSTDLMVDFEESGSERKKKGNKSRPQSEEGLSTDENVEISSIDTQPKSTSEPETAVGSFILPGSKKNKKKKKSISFAEDEIVSGALAPPFETADREPEQEAQSDFVIPGSKKSKKKSKKSQSWEPEPEIEPAQAENQPGSTRDTVGETWEDAPEFHDGQLPAASSSDSASTLLPLAAIGAAGAVALTTRSLEDDPKQPGSLGTSDLIEDNHSVSLEIPEPKSESLDNEADKSTSDGFQAGYNNEQLNLARRLQEEFAAGSKKSKKDKQKDKKKRQSLPSTPESELSRSRGVQGDIDAQPRARSLSIGPSTAERSEDAPNSQERRSLYSADQLEFARQLKSDFDSGNLRSKKEKKRRSGLATQSSTQGDLIVDENLVESPASVTPSPALPQDAAESAVRGDGFAAGYQEDQLSLARQLQAEFGSGSKKSSKKDKKRQSMSSSPMLESKFRDDYFGEVSPTPVAEPLSPRDTQERIAEETGDQTSDTILNDATTRGPNDDFEPVSKKSSKGKKRNKLVDDTPAPDPDTLPSTHQDTPDENTDATSRDTDAAATPLSDNEGFSMGKKSKKGKKGSKKASQVSSFDNEDVSANPSDRNMEHNTDETQTEQIPQENPPTTPAPEDEEVFAIKKSKKDKKGKKRASQLSSVDKEDASFSPSPQDTEQNDDETLNEPAQIAPPIVADEDEEFFTTKKSKKDKKAKKRANQVSGLENEDVPPETQTPSQPEDSVQPLDQPRNVDDIAQTPQDDDFGFSTKKSKKDKKRKSALDSAREEPIQTSKSAAQEESAQDLGQVKTEDSAQVSQGEELEFASKKSKKDKKRESPLAAVEEKPVEPPEPAIMPSISRSATSTNVNESYTDPGIVEDPAPGETSIAASMIQNSEPEGEAEKAQSSSIENEVPADIPATGNEPALEADESEWVLKPSKKSKRGKKEKGDKNKRTSVPSTPSEEPAPDFERAINAEEDIIADSGNTQSPIVTEKTKDPDAKPQSEPLALAEQAVVGANTATDDVGAGDFVKQAPFTADEVPSAPAATEPEEEWSAFVVKKPKKGKKNRKSGLSTPAEEPSDAASGIPVQENVVPVEPQSNLLPSVPNESQPEHQKIAESVSNDLSRDLIDDTNPKTLEDPSTEASTAVEPTMSQDPYMFTADEPSALESGSRKSSKKDKRKRQATIDAPTTDAAEAPKTPVRSWADDIEEAEIERKDPVIDDIAKDESLSQVASSTQATSSNDFVRPSKKGKKGKKRTSDIDATLADDVVIPPTDKISVAEEPSKNDSDLPVLASAGIALASAALAGDILRKEQEQEKSSDADSKIPGEPASTKPARKLSKKEKRKMSIDKRTPTEDVFDDPALWEGKEPKIFEEPKSLDDNIDDDGFWKQDDDQSTTKDQSSQPADEGLVTLPTETERSLSEQQLDDSKTPLLASRDPPDSEEPELKITPSDQPKAEEQWNDLPDEFVVTSTKKDKKKKKRQSRSAAWDVPGEEGVRTAEASAISEDSLPSVPQPPLETAWSDRELPPVIEPPTEQARDLNDFAGLTGNLPADLPSIKEEAVEHSGPLTFGHSGPPNMSDMQEKEHVPLENLDGQDANRDSAFVAGSPIPTQLGFAEQDEHVRDSGVHLRETSPSERSREPISTSDAALQRMDWPAVDEETDTVDLGVSQRKPGLLAKRWEETVSSRRSDPDLNEREKTERRSPSELDVGKTTTDLHRTKTIHRAHRAKEESAESEQSPKQAETKTTDLHRTQTIHGHHKLEGESRDIHRTPSIHGHHKDGETDLHRTHTIYRPKSKEGSLVSQRVQRIESPDIEGPQRPKEGQYGSLKSSSKPKAERSPGFKDNSIGPGLALAGAATGFAAARQASLEKRSDSVNSNRSTPNINRLRTPAPEQRPDSVNSSRSSGTPPLRRSDRKSGDLRSLSQRSKPDLAKEAELAAASTTSSLANTANPTANEGRVRAKDMADVYDGFGEGRMGSPRSPTRPHSMRRRQSMQVLDLEARLEQLATENRMLADAKAQAEHLLQTHQPAAAALVERDAEIDSLKRTLAWLQNEVTRLTEHNDGLASANVALGDKHNLLETQHAQTARELQETRELHDNVSGGLQGDVQDKDRQIAELRAQLEAATEQIREMQRQILAAKANDSEFLTVRDEDYFDTACQQLCQHVQQWVLRFSKFSDMRACRLTSEINNDKTIDRLDNAILDGSDVDSYLADRVKRRDVFMSMTMTMVWEFVFTRYLFGMDREQRQKLKSLEKLLSEVGPASAVHQWRATTLTLLSKRESFIQQREQDTLAVVNAILETLTEILPPPSHLEEQIQEQLMRVMKAAVDLSIEMRTQRAEYMMLPPLQPEYDANGDLASKVSFNAALMNERSGDTVSNEELEAAGTFVRIVLFPLVVKKGDDRGVGDEEIVVCPAQVLVAKPKKVRVFSPDSMVNQSRVSMQSSMPADYGDAI